MTTCSFGLRADEGVRPYLHITIVIHLPLFNVISTEVRVKPERSGEIPRGCQSITLLFAILSTVFVGVADGRAVRPRTADRVDEERPDLIRLPLGGEALP